MNGREWIDAFSERLGVASPTAQEWSRLLELAGEAAHTSERMAAPISCWLAARAGIDPERALVVARELEATGERDGAA